MRRLKKAGVEAMNDIGKIKEYEEFGIGGLEVEEIKIPSRW